MEWEPTASVPVDKDAWPLALRVPVPSVAAPSLKVTVPVGVPVAGAVAATVAVRVTDCPNTEGLADEATVLAVLPLATMIAFGSVLPVPALPFPLQVLF